MNIDNIQLIVIRAKNTLAPKICPTKILHIIYIIMIEEEKQDITLAGKRRQRVGPIHIQYTVGAELLECPYLECSKKWKNDKPGKSCMSRHMKDHSEAGHKLKPTEGAYGLIELAEKYEDREKDEGRDETNTYQAANEEDDEGFASRAKEHKEKCEATLKKTLWNFVEWKNLADEEFLVKVPYIVFAKAMIGYASDMKVLVRCTALEMVDAITKNDGTMKEIKGLLGTLKKAHESTRKDMQKMSKTVVDKATELEGVGAKLDIARCLTTAADVRKAIIDQGSDITETIIANGFASYETKILKRSAKAAFDSTMGALRAVNNCGVPVLGGLKKPLEILSVEEAKEFNESEDVAAELIGMETRKAARYLPQVRKKKMIEKACHDTMNSEVPVLEIEPIPNENIPDPLL